MSKPEEPCCKGCAENDVLMEELRARGRLEKCPAFGGPHRPHDFQGEFAAFGIWCLDCGALMS